MVTKDNGIKTRFAETFFSLAALLAGQTGALAQDVGSKDVDGNTYLHFQQLEGVYSNDWTGKVSEENGDGSKRVDILAEGKLPFDGVLTISCKAGGKVNWDVGEDSFLSADDVPSEVVANAKKHFC